MVIDCIGNLFQGVLIARAPGVGGAGDERHLLLQDLGGVLANRQKKFFHRRITVADAPAVKACQGRLKF